MRPVLPSEKVRRLEHFHITGGYGGAVVQQGEATRILSLRMCMSLESLDQTYGCTKPDYAEQMPT